MKKVAICKTTEYKYPNETRPSFLYPEYLLGDMSSQVNSVYEIVRECFRMLELDKEHYGTNIWNPLGDYITPGDSVLIKPNLVMDFNALEGSNTDCLYTNPSVVAAVLDYVIIALKGSGRIIVGDAPMQECDFDKLIKNSGYFDLIQYYKSKGVNIELVDFRELITINKNGIYKSTVKEGGLKGKTINLKEESEFFGLYKNDEEKLRITNYDPRILPTHHQGTTHEYYISQYVLDADVIINMPKPKTHRKAGVTISMKNMVGANVRKEYLPHHTQGSIKEGGDEYLKKSMLKKVESRLYDIRNVLRAEKHYKKARLISRLTRPIDIFFKLTNNKYSEGSWYGNRTISRTICDLNKVIYFADKDGIMRNDKQRKVFIVADMIVSGEKEGPILPSPKNVGIIAMGDDPFCFDKVIATIMGFDIDKIPTFETVANYKGSYKFFDDKSKINVISNDKSFEGMSVKGFKYENSLQYEPTEGWKGHIEL